MTAQGTHFINNEWKIGTGPALTSHNSATGEVLWQGYSATEQEVQAAVDAARGAFKKWSALPLEKRIEYLQHFGTLLKESSDKLAEAISKDVGKPLWESKSEVSAMINKIQISIDAYHRRCAEIVHTHPSGKSITRHKPHGVIVVLGPFNFPGHIPNGHIVPALLAGNTIVFKPSELTPLVAEETIRIWEKCDLPPGVVNMVQGGRETGRLLTGHRDINGLLFTGSWETGRILSEQFAKTPEKILALELGGNNPLIIDEVKDLEAAAYVTLLSGYLTSGQRCTCARRLIVPQGALGNDFLKTLVGMVENISLGPYTDVPEPFMGPVISERAASHLLAAQDILLRSGGKPLVQMKLMKVDTAFLSPGLIDVTTVRNRPDEEFFGPIMQVIRVPDFTSAIAEANHTAFGLVAGLVSSSHEKYDQFLASIRAGVIAWNAPTTGASSSAPFGGIKRSGNFRPSGYYAADYCAYPVAAIESPTLKMPETLLPGLKSTN